MTNEDRIKVGGLSIAPEFHRFVEGELLPEIGFDAAQFWAGVEAIINDLSPTNRELLAIRDALQQKIDEWHAAREGQPLDHDEYLSFLRDIDYLADVDTFTTIDVDNVDAEIAEVAGPQLVVPVNNARFAINAANARWGSLYDALYGTDAIAEDNGRERSGEYNAVRGAAVIRAATEFLDTALPLADVSHSDVNRYGLDKNGERYCFVASLANGETRRLADPEQFVGCAEKSSLTTYLFKNHGLHVELHVDPTHPIGKDATANVADVVLESAITTIQDCEDSVAAVDAADKVGVYRNWLGLMRVDLEAAFIKNGQERVRSIAKDRAYTAADGSELILSGRSLLLVRNVGHLMTNDAILDARGSEVFEGILDAIVTTACAMTDRHRDGYSPNSRTGSIYIVKPKMHGPDEVAFTDTLFARVEGLFDLEPNTLKVGIMDEERRTTVNLPACIAEAHQRVVFINTGFLDRTGDEIHTSMLAGAVLPKEAIKEEPWIKAYEDWNVDVGIRSGLPGKAQIGKGMWPKPDEMRQMLDTKQAHPEAGANCAWVPSPTAATLHAMHYHAVDVRAVQAKLAKRPLASLDAILTPPLAGNLTLSREEIQAELNNNAQGILGYVVRWIDQGVGCSKVPDINDVGLMEDRATLRISSQHIANWLRHGITNEEEVTATFRRMAEIVDQQNAGDPAYEPMSADFDNSIAFQAACALVFAGCEQPSGYTEPLLHQFRRQKKSVARLLAVKSLLALTWLALALGAAADEPLTVAVASNFHATADKLAAEFTASTGIDVRLSGGSTGKLYAQIVNGAPYDVFLAADVARPQRLLDLGFALEGSLVEYARGVLVLVSAEPGLTGTDCRGALDSGAFRKFAIANPETAPYGYAARAWLQAAGYWEAASDRLIMGENINQTYQFVVTRNATLGLVAASQLRRGNVSSPVTCRSKVDLPAKDVLRQGAVELRRSKVPGHARQFMVYLASAAAARLIAGDGYAVEGR